MKSGASFPTSALTILLEKMGVEEATQVCFFCFYRRIQSILEGIDVKTKFPPKSDYFGLRKLVGHFWDRVRRKPSVFGQDVHKHAIDEAMRKFREDRKAKRKKN